MRPSQLKLIVIFCLLVLAIQFTRGMAQQPLLSWNESPRKQAILDFVARVTREGGPDYVAPSDRIATFDNDGTLWSEMPIYFQFEFALYRVRGLAPQHPEWKTQEPFKSALEGNVKGMLAGGEKGLTAMMMATHTGMTTDDFRQIVEAWLATARHPRFDRPYTELVFQPMLELLEFLRASGFKTFIVSGGGIDFMRPWTGRVYGIPPEHVVGSTAKVEFRLQNDVPQLFRLPAINFIDDGPGKPVGIHQHIGHRPIAAFGNSDGDYEMLRWTTAGAGPRFGLIVHHTDAEREWAYDRDSAIGRLKRALDEAPERGWHVVDMKQDWRVIYPWEKPTSAQSVP
ncbi:MAG: haloacid dehalogenase-like hydrolase [Pirellulales bacterium]|nr:haloacid dehalogenase-like hydrolase [Pirellulales bacterium]